jgi:hypothetical protein
MSEGPELDVLGYFDRFVRVATASVKQRDALNG